jgi:hypothetical protein
LIKLSDYLYSELQAECDKTQWLRYKKIYATKPWKYIIWM